MGHYRVLELFSGNGDITKRLNDNYENISCYSVDYNPNYKAEYCEDVYKLKKYFLKTFDFIWLSPDCTTYSYASHGLHRRKGGVPVSDYAKECDENNRALIKKLIELDIPFIMENPRAHMRNMDFTKGLYRTTVYFSTYGAPYAKPTDLFSNRDLKGFFNEKVTNTGKHLDYVCSNAKDFLGRCRIPQELLKDICEAIVIMMYNERRTRK